MFLQEYSSAILNYLCENDDLLQAMLGNFEFIQSLFARIMRTSDPDVLVQSLEILLNLCKANSKIICSMNNVPLESILSATGSAYPKIQATSLLVFIEMGLCGHLVCRDFFIKSTFLDQTMSILEVSLFF